MKKLETKQELLIALILKQLNEIKVGLIVKGIDNISPEKIARQLGGNEKHFYVAAIGYDGVLEHSEDYFDITNTIEKAVLWRSNPAYAGRIVVFIKNDTDKLHSLAEFESITTRDVSKFLIEQQINPENNIPTNNFWTALKEDSDYYIFDDLYEFVSAIIKEGEDVQEAIPKNMWILNLLQDHQILSAKNKPRERLEKNRTLILAIGQMREDSRKKLCSSLVRTKTKEDKERLQKAYRDLQNYYKYGDKKTLQKMDFETVQELLVASQKIAKKKKKNISTSPDCEGFTSDDNTSAPIRPKELDSLISETLIFGNEEEMKDVQDLLATLNKHYDTETEENDDTIPPLGGIFENRNIVLESHQTDLRKLVGKFCSIKAWGGIMETEEGVLKDAISADIKEIHIFDPDSKKSLVSFSGGIDGSQSLFSFIIQFDGQFEQKGFETAERFSPIIENLRKKREKLLSCIDMIMYHPVLFFGASEGNKNSLIEYIEAWEKLYHAFCVNESIMRQISSTGTNFIAKAILLLDILYVQTPKEWKGILLPLHPVYLWRYYEVFKTFPNQKYSLSEADKEALAKVLTQLPQVLSFIVANNIVTNTAENRILPCSGNIEMLPTFENKTNRYLGIDGTESVEEILTRWIGFALYTQNEIRVCSVDAPDLIGTLRQLKSFMDKNSVKRIVFDVYLTRNQNGNTELAKLDYSGKDYEIGEYIRKNRIIISIRNLKSSSEVKKYLDLKPVHVAFYFDQSSYAIEFGPSNHNLYINPLVITYDYDFDDIQHKGSIYPSSETDSGLVCEYHKMMKFAEIISNNMNPRTTYNGNADMTAVVSTIQDKQTQWLVVADRDTNNYQPKFAIPIGEMQYDKRMVNVWAADNSRIISQYMTLLRRYNLYPKTEKLIEILQQFGHIASNGLISIPKSGADAQSVDNKKKGLLGTLFAASWYKKQHNDALVASLDDDKARLWLQNSKYGNERADLVGLYYEEKNNTLHVEPIEVKTRDESPDAIFSKDDLNSKVLNISGHAAEQLGSMVEILKEIFTLDESQIDMFTSARREVLKYQIVSECFRNVHDATWQKKWYMLLKKAFTKENEENFKISVSGLLLHIKLNETTGKEHILCKNPDYEDCKIDYWKLTSKEIQKDVFDMEPQQEKADIIPDFDETDDTSIEIDSYDAIVDTDIIGKINTLCSANEEQVAENPKREIFSRESEETEINEEGQETQKEEADVSIIGTHGVSKKEISQLVRDFKRACGDYHITLRECEDENSVVGPSVIRLKFKLGRGQSLKGLSGHLEDIGREMKRTGVIIQQIPNSDELLLDVPRLQREKVLFKDVIRLLPTVTSPEQLYFPLGRTPNGKDLFEDLSQMPHMLVGGSTGSGKSVFLFTMLAAMLMTHPDKEDLQLILSSSKYEDFIHFEKLPHLYSGSIISDAAEATRVIKDVVFEESERRGKLLAEARVANIIEYNKKVSKKLNPIVVVIDEFADLADQLESKSEQNAFYKPVQRIAQTGRSRGIHLVLCTQRPEAKLVPATTKAQLNGRVALRVNDGISSRMIIESPEAQYLQKHGDMIYKNGDIVERAQGYLIEIPELDQIVEDVILGRYKK